jgi:hypothetical protein
MSTQPQSLVKQGQKDIVRDGAFDLTPHSLSEAFQLAEMMSKSALVPDAFRGKTGDILIAVQLGSEIGLKPMQALSGICVINGRPTVWGDAALAVVLNSGLMENYKEMTCEEIEAAGKAVFWAKRVNLPEPIIREFSIEDAKKARLWNNDKKPIWKDYPWRMLQMRARSWALRDGFADALKGMAIREEVEDIPTTEAPPVLAMPRRLSEREQDGKPEPPAITDGTTAAPAEPIAPSDPSGVITGKQASRVWAIGYSKNLDQSKIVEIIKSFGYPSASDVKVADYDNLIKAIELGICKE